MNAPGGETLHRPRSRWRRSVDGAAVLAFVALWLAQGADWATALAPTRAALLLVLAIPLGAAMADLATGLAHWGGDTFFREDTPIIGARWIRPFREHHRDPLAMTEHGILEVSGNPCLVLALLLALAHIAGVAFRESAHPFLGATLLVFCLAVAVANSAHRWAHVAHPPRWIAHLQRWRLLLPPGAHARHHDGCFDRAFCVATGWCNPVLDRSALLPWLEARLARCATRYDRPASGH